MGLMGLIMASHGCLQGIQTAHTKSTDHPSEDSMTLERVSCSYAQKQIPNNRALVITTPETRNPNA